MGVPFLLLECPGFTFAAARQFVSNLDEELPKKNPSAMGVIVDYLGTDDLSELKKALSGMLDSVEGERTIPWNSNARDEQILGQAMHIAERMGELVGITVQWQGDKKLTGAKEEDGIKTQIMRLRRAESSKFFKSNLDAVLLQSKFGGVVLCDRSAVHAEARVLQVELSKVLQRPVLVGGDLEEKIVLKTIEEADHEVVVALLMTAEVLANSDAMLEAAAAVKADRLLVPVMVYGYGYGYHMAHPMINKLELDGFSTEEMTEARKALLDVIPNTIAVDWNPVRRLR